MVHTEEENELKGKRQGFSPVVRLCLGLTCLSNRLSSWDCLAALTALSICAWRPVLSSKVTATWFSKVTTRRMMLCSKDRKKKKAGAQKVNQSAWESKWAVFEALVFVFEWDPTNIIVLFWMNKRNDTNSQRKREKPDM